MYLPYVSSCDSKETKVNSKTIMNFIKDLLTAKKGLPQSKTHFEQSFLFLIDEGHLSN